MPGIVGLITKMPRQVAEPQLVRMVEALCHESFYETGTLVDESLGIYVGWAALRNSFCSGMPVYSEKKDIVLVFSGDNYSDPGTSTRLKQLGHEVDARGSSYLIHLYEEDPFFIAGLNGRWHGLLIDRRQGTARLFNDRFGMHRINYHESKEAFYFAAEAKAILAVRPELRAVDAQALGELVSCGCVMGNRTLFKGIQLLPPAAAWVARKGSITQRNTYFQTRE